MSIQQITNGDTLLNIRNAINNNFTELEENIAKTKNEILEKPNDSMYLRGTQNYGRLFSDTSEFILWYGFVEHSTDNVQTGATSLKISVDATSNTTSAAQYRDVFWNLSKAKNVLIRFYAPVMDGLSKFTLRFYTAGTEYMQYELSRWKMVAGWNEMLVPLNKMTLHNGATTTILASITHVQLSVTGSAEVSVWFDSIWANHIEKANIIINFDDAWNTAYTKAFPIMRRLGFVGNIGVISDVVGTGNYMTETQLDTAYKYGWDLFNHTKSHTSLVSLDSAGIKEQLNTCRDWLYNKGYTRSPKYVAYPYGDHNDTVLSVMQQEGYVLGRTVSPEMEVSPPIQPYKLKVFEVTNSITTTEFEPLIDSVSETGGTLILLFHKIEDTGTDNIICLTDYFADFLDYIYGKECNVITISEWINSIDI